MNNLTTQRIMQPTLAEIRADKERFPRLLRLDRESAIKQLNAILLMAFTYRNQPSDVHTISMMSSNLYELLLLDEYNIGTKYISMEEIHRVVRKAALGQGKEMYGVSVSSVFQAIADYCKGEGKTAQEQAVREHQHLIEANRQKLIGPMIDRYSQTIGKGGIK